jgi:hypothetical protein
MEQQMVSEAVKRQHEIVRLAVVALAALIAFAETRGDPLVAVTIYGLVPGAATLLLALWMGEADSVRDICAAAADKATADVKHIFENELRRTRDLSMYVALSFAAAGIVALWARLSRAASREVRLGLVRRVRLLLACRSLPNDYERNTHVARAVAIAMTPAPSFAGSE